MYPQYVNELVLLVALVCNWEAIECWTRNILVCMSHEKSSLWEFPASPFDSETHDIQTKLLHFFSVTFLPISM